MRIPEVAARLREKAIETGDPELVTLADELRRRKPVTKAPPTSAPMTPELEAQIRAFAKANPKMPQHQIAWHFEVNSGRVSVALHGERK